MPKPTIYVTQEEYDADPKRVYELSKSNPVAVRGKGERSFLVSRGFYPDENDCLECMDTIVTCDLLKSCPGKELRALRKVAEAAWALLKAKPCAEGGTCSIDRNCEHVPVERIDCSECGAYARLQALLEDT